MQRLAVFLATTAFSGLAPVQAQAPASVDLWRVTGTTLTLPPPLATGATAIFWNPAARNAHSLAGLEVVQTSDILGLSGLLLGAIRQFGSRFGGGLILGRMKVRDLVRTTTSPNSVAGDIPVHDQLLGVRAAYRADRFSVGTLLRIHDSRFDVVSEGGVTLDLGFTLQPVDGLRVAGATHFLPVDLSSQPTTDYYLAVEYEPLSHEAQSGLRTRLLARYGLAHHAQGSTDHMASAGLRVNEQFGLDLALTREAARGHVAWRPAVSLSLQVGRYTITAARGSGVNEVGGTFRVGLDVVFK